MKIAGSRDAVLSLLTDSRRRQVLYCLRSNERTDLDSIALQIAAWERDETIASVEGDAVDAVKLSLHHNHLPKLAEAGVVEYDSRAGDVVRRDGFHDIEALVDQLQASEDEADRDDATDASTGDCDRESFLSP